MIVNYQRDRDCNLTRQEPYLLSRYNHKDKPKEFEMKEYPTQEQIKALLDYNPLTGSFVWKERPIEAFTPGKYQLNAYMTFHGRYAGKPAGRFDKDGYLKIPISPLPGHFMAHRLAWVYVYGYDPGELDHKNRTPSDIRIDNLREATHADNLKNFGIRKDSKSGVNGVTFHERYNAWRARIKVGYKSIHLGMFPDFSEAVKARYAAEVQYGFTQFNPNSTAYQYLQEA